LGGFFGKIGYFKEIEGLTPMRRKPSGEESPDRKKQGIWKGRNCRKVVALLQRRALTQVGEWNEYPSRGNLKLRR